MNMWPCPVRLTTPVSSIGRWKPLTPPPRARVTVAPVPAAASLATAAASTSGTSARPSMPDPLDRLQDDGAVARRRLPEHRVPGVAQHDQPALLAIGRANRLVRGDALGHLEVGTHGPREIGHLVGHPFGVRLVAVGDDHGGPAAFLDVQPGLHRESSRS